jgi:hypothetical protein
MFLSFLSIFGGDKKGQILTVRKTYLVMSPNHAYHMVVDGHIVPANHHPCRTPPSWPSISASRPTALCWLSHAGSILFHQYVVSLVARRNMLPFETLLLRLRKGATPLSHYEIKSSSSTSQGIAMVPRTIFVWVLPTTQMHRNILSVVQKVILHLSIKMCS